MNGSKLIYILRLFSKDEIKSFEKFIISPYFAVGRDVSGLYSILKKYHPQFDIEDLKKEAVYKKLFGNGKFNEKKLKNLSSDLTRLAEQFLVHESVKKDRTSAEKILAESYKIRNAEKLFLLTLNSLEKKIEENLFSSVHCFKEEEKKERLKEEYYIGVNRFDRSIPLRIKYTDYFTLTFLVSFLRKLREKIILPGYYKIPFESPLINSMQANLDFEGLMDSLRKSNFDMLWLMEIYYNLYKCMAEPGHKSYYRKFKQQFLENIAKFSRAEKYFILNDCVSYCIQEDRSEQTEYMNEELDVYEHMFAENAYSPGEEEYLSVVLYRNIMLLALDLGNYEWLGKFIETHSDKLKPDFRENMVNLASANLHFSKGEFEKALICTGKVEYDFFLYKTDIKNLMLKIYYELGLYDQAFSLIDAFRHFLHDTDEISRFYKFQHQNFLNIYNKLLKARSDGDISGIDFVLNEMNSLGLVTSKKWLMNKGNELLKKELA